MNKKCESDLERWFVVIGGVVIVFFFIGALFSSGVIVDIMKAFTTTFGAIGAVIGVLFIILIAVAIIENFKGK